MGRAYRVDAVDDTPDPTVERYRHLYGKQWRHVRSGTVSTTAELLTTIRAMVKNCSLEKGCQTLDKAIRDKIYVEEKNP